MEIGKKLFEKKEVLDEKTLGDSAILEAIDYKMPEFFDFLRKEFSSSSVVFEDVQQREMFRDGEFHGEIIIVDNKNERRSGFEVNTLKNDWVWNIDGLVYPIS